VERFQSHDGPLCPIHFLFEAQLMETVLPGFAEFVHHVSLLKDSTKQLSLAQDVTPGARHGVVSLDALAETFNGTALCHPASSKHLMDYEYKSDISFELYRNELPALPATMLSYVHHRNNLLLRFQVPHQKCSPTRLMGSIVSSSRGARRKKTSFQPLLHKSQLGRHNDKVLKECLPV
jgi:hypothetical protein